MSFKHEKMQKVLLDVCYGEMPMTEEISKHLDYCSECKAYWNELMLVRESMSGFNDNEIEIDSSIINSAFLKSSIEIKRRKNLKDLIIFSVISVLLLGMLGLLVYVGYGRSIIVAQIILMFFVPLSVPIMIRQRIMKEESL